MFFGLDPVYFLFVGPTLLLSFWASSRVKSTFNRWNRVVTNGGYSGAEIARAILDSAGLHHVRVEPTSGSLSDHYDPTSKTLRLSEATYSSTSVAAAGVAAHEAGHALQDKVRYPMLTFRSAIVPLAGFGANISWILIMIGAFLMATAGAMGKTMVLVGIILFSTTVVFQLITVPVEIDASNRAKRVLREMRFATPEEGRGVSEVLNAAAWTYVAAATSSVATLLYFIFRFAGGND